MASNCIPTWACARVRIFAFDLNLRTNNIRNVAQMKTITQNPAISPLGTESLYAEINVWRWQKESLSMFDWSADICLWFSRQTRLSFWRRWTAAEKSVKVAERQSTRCLLWMWNKPIMHRNLTGRKRTDARHGVLRRLSGCERWDSGWWHEATRGVFKSCCNRYRRHRVHDVSWEDYFLSFHGSAYESHVSSCSRFLMFEISLNVPESSKVAK